MNDSIKAVLHGLTVGASMSVPGVSGGSMAIILGIYDRLLRSVGEIFKKPKESLPYLIKFSAGAAAGIFLIAGAVNFVLGTPAGLPLRFFFLGAVAGGIPMILRKAKPGRVTPSTVLLILSGVAAVLLLGLIPEGLFSPAKDGAGAAVIQFAGGILVAAALVLPGISASHIMYMLGIYEPAAECLSRMDIIPLIPLGLGLAVGTFLTAKLFGRLMERHGGICYPVILGFMCGSLYELIPEVTFTWQWLLGGVCTAAGFVLVRAVCLRETAANSQPHSH